MYLKSLELTGFKSFVKKTSLNFNTPITGIVGPNGSGKSNTAEAFRFVLGEQSIKSLRGKRGEDMIWNGGANRLSDARANRASVKLIFDNSGRLFQGIDFDEVSIERVVHRDNSNEYLLNGSQVRLKDIIEMLAGAHIGSTGHQIISQGEADRILSASIRERREMIEDALGLKIYQWKKAESLRKLDKTEENMKQVESLRREIAPHLKFLKKQVEKVERAEQLRLELITLYQEYFFAEHKQIKAEKERIGAELVPPKNELHELEVSLEHAKKILTDSKNKDVKSDKLISIEEKQAANRREKDSITREVGRLEGEINANRRAIDKEKDKQQRDEFKTVYLKDVEEIVKKVEGFESLADVKKLFSEVISTLQAFVARHRSNSDSGLIGEAEKEINFLSKERTSLEGKLSDLNSHETELIRHYNELKETIEKEKDTNREAEKDVFKIIARQNEVRHLYEKLSTEWNSLTHREENFKRELGDAAQVAGRAAVDYQNMTSAVTSLSQEELRHKIEKNKIRLEDSGAAGGAEVLKEFKETEERDLFLGRELEDLVKAKDELAKLIKELDLRIDVEFKTGIAKINNEFNKYFSLMFDGGKAELTVVAPVKRKKKSDEDDLVGMLGVPEELQMPGADGDLEADQNLPEGVDVSVSLPRKKVKGLVMLSGGERALTSIALLFAISQVNPPPFIILDETDAALDEANSRKYGDMIENLSKHSQLILITHNRETMSRAGVLYGVTMGSDGASRLLSIQFEEAVKVAK